MRQNTIFRIIGFTEKIFETSHVLKQQHDIEAFAKSIDKLISDLVAVGKQRDALNKVMMTNRSMKSINQSIIQECEDSLAQVTRIQATIDDCMQIPETSKTGIAKTADQIEVFLKNLLYLLA